MDKSARKTEGSPTERRRARRQPLITQALLFRDDRETSPQRVMLKDVSLLGLGFESSTPIEPGTLCRLRVEAGPMQMSVLLRVVCCQRMPEPEDAYRLGGEFIFHQAGPEESQEAESGSDSGAD